MRAAYFTARFAALCTILAATACAAAPPVPTTATPTSTDAESSSTPATPSALPSAAASSAAAPLTSAPVTYRRGAEVRKAWESYPWAPDDGLACPYPGASPGIRTDPAGPGVAVVVGDSLVRESREAITAALGEVGFEVVFVCWGGKNLLWGMEQIETLRALDLMPACLVVNLGTNDLKGTTAQGLADAVPLETVDERLQSLLSAVQDVPDVFVVDLAADLSLAPGTMSDVGEVPGVWQAAVEATGVGAAIPWSSAASQGGLIGGDGVHDTSAGQYVRAALIAEYVVRDCSV